jgi:hypothetical protein
MKRQAGLLLLITLAACASGPRDDSAEAACRRQAYDDPKVKSLLIQNLGWSAPDPNLYLAINNAMRDATQKCLQDKGIATRGGVESVRPYSF